MSTTASASSPRTSRQTRPATPISLSKAGVTRSAKAIRIRHDGAEQLFQAEVACSCDLDPLQKGVHMSRFEETVNEAIDEVVIGEALRIEALAERIAQRVVESQRALRSEVTIRASYPVEKRTPVTDIPTQEMYGLIGIAARQPHRQPPPGGGHRPGHERLPVRPGAHPRPGRRTRCAPTASPRTRSRASCSLVPIATHNQRARGTLYLGAPERRWTCAPRRSWRSSRTACRPRSTS